jgi:hypothetical protein
LTPHDDTPYRRMGMSYQIEEIVVPALAHVVVIISLWFDIFDMLFIIWLINAPIIDVIN